MIDVRIQEAPLDGAGAGLPAAGARAVAEFRGVVGGECHRLRVGFPDEEGALRALRERAGAVARKFALRGAVVVHRKGLLSPGEALVYAAVAADHRADALRGLDALLAGLRGLATKEEG